MEARPRALSRLPSYSQLSTQNKSPTFSKSNTSRLSIDNIRLREDHEYLDSLYKRSQFLQTLETRVELEKIFSSLNSQPKSGIDFSEDEQSPHKKEYWGMLAQSLLNPFSRAHSTLLRLMKENVSKKIQTARRFSYFKRGSSLTTTPRRSHSEDSFWQDARNQKDPTEKPLNKINEMKKKLIDIVNSHQQACTYVSQIQKKLSSSSLKQSKQPNLRGNEMRRKTAYISNRETQVQRDRSKLIRWKTMNSPEVDALTWKFSTQNPGISINSRPYQTRKDSSFSFGDFQGEEGFKNQGTEPAQIIMVDSMSPFSKTPLSERRQHTYQSTPSLTPNEPKLRKPKQIFSRSRFFINSRKLPAGCSSTRMYNSSPSKPEFSVFGSFADRVGAPFAGPGHNYESNCGYLLKKKNKEKILLPLTARPSLSQRVSPQKHLSRKFIERVEKAYLKEEN